MRRERYRRRQQERIEQARREFEAQIARSQEYLRRWGEGKEPSPARTRQERIMRTLLEMWRVFGDVGAKWNDMHQSFSGAIEKRNNLIDQAALDDRTVQLVDTGLVRALNQIVLVDESLDSLLTTVSAAIATARSVLEQPWPPGRAVARAVRVPLYLITVLTQAGEYQTRLRKAHQVIAAVPFPLALNFRAPRSEVRPF